MSKTVTGNFFEDFTIGQEIFHPTPRTLNEGDVALYTALYGSRLAVNSSVNFAMALGFEDAPVDDLLTFHIVFGKTVPDISLNAVANLGYADCRFIQPVFPGDTLSAQSRVIGLKENSNGKTGVVYVATVGINQMGEAVLQYVRWVMVNKRDAGSPTSAADVPDLPDHVPADELLIPERLDFQGYDTSLAGSPHLWDDYEAGEKIDHVDGMTIEAADHMMATRLYQNTARVHFNLFHEKSGRLGERIVYGGHVISLARSISFNGLANACFVAAINGGRHVAPCIAGNTVFAWSEILEKAEIPGRTDVGALRIRLVATKDQPCSGFPYKDSAGQYDPAVVLDLDYWALMPRR